MKKMMVMLAAVAMAFGLQASQVSWKLTTGTTYEDMTVYGVGKGNVATILSALQGTDSTKWTTVLNGAVGAQSSTGTRGLAGGTTADVVAGDSLVFVIFDGAVAEGTDFWVLNATTLDAKNIYTPPTTPVNLTLKVADLGVAGSGTLTAGGPVPTPEPTSGLLLLLGMAGLALRRRHA